MGVMQQKKPTKPRPAPVPSGTAAGRGPSTPEPQNDCTATSTHTDAGVAIAVIMTKTAEDDRKVPASAAVNAAHSPVRSMRSNTPGLNITSVALDMKDKHINGLERVTLPPSDNEADGNTTDKIRPANDDLGLKLSNLTLDDNDLTQQLKELNIKEKEKDKDDKDLTQQLNELKIKENEKDENDEHYENSDLVSRGLDRTVRRGTRTVHPYVLEQHIVSSDNHGGATVLYPNIPQRNNFASCQNVPSQEISHSYWQCFRKDTGNLNYNNCQTVLQDTAQETSHNELQNISFSPSVPEIPHLTEEDLKILEILSNNILNSSVEHQPSIEQQSGTVTQYLSPPLPDERSSDSFVFDIDEIIRNDRYDNGIKDIKEELFKEGIDKQLPPTPDRDSAYDSDEGTIGSPASAVSVEQQIETEKFQSVSSSLSTVIAQQNNVLRQTGFPPASVSPIIQTVPSGMVVVMPPPVTQSLVSPTTPPISAFVPRPILPGVNIPPPCNEPALKRITPIMTEQVKDKVWAITFAKPDSEFTREDEDGNKVLGYMLSNRQKYKNFMEVLHAIIQRLKRIIGRNQEMARDLLAAPNRCGHTPLDLACRYFQSGEQDALVVRYLADTMMEEGLEIGKELDSNGNTLLHKICDYGDKARFIMAELLSMKDRCGNSIFDVNRGNNERKTPLHVAALKHNEQTPCTVLAQLLMRSGALASEQEGCSGNTVFHCVAQVSCDPNLLVTLLAKTRDVETVVNKANFNGDTPLHMVAANPTITLEYQRLAVQHLIHYGAQPRLTNKSGKVPLSLVAADRKQDIKTVLYHK